MDTTSGAKSRSERLRELSLSPRTLGESVAKPTQEPGEAITPAAAGISVARRRLEEKSLAFTEVPIGTLFGQLFDEMNELVRKEVDLARAEIQSNVEDGVRMVKWFSVAGVCAASAMTLLLMAGVFALAEKVPGWAAALILAGILLAAGIIASLIGWRGRIRTVLAATQRSLKGNMQWKNEI
jgi:Putative Actinobacterial Holin-X, holin superfamily III